MTRLDGSHVLITGGSQGIGLSVARHAAQRGARVSLIARGTAQLARAKDYLERVTGRVGAVVTRPADVTDAGMLQAAVASAEEESGPTDVLLTAAGGAAPGHFESLLSDDFAQQMDLNFFGTLNAVRAVTPVMIERGHGHLVLMSSTAGLIGVYGYSAYSPAKFAVRGLAETLRSELTPYGIVVGCAFPPDTQTPGFDRENVTKPAATRRISAAIRPRTPDSVARAIITGIERDRMVITADTTTALLAHAGGLLSPVARRSMDRHIRAATRGR